MFGFTACDFTDEKTNPVEIVAEQSLNYNDSLAAVYNPDQGFYVPINVTVTPDGVTYNREIVTDNVNLYHLRMDISAYSTNAGGEDTPLTDDALSGIKNLLQYLRVRDKNAIVRFCYSPGFGDAVNCEPALEDIVNHVKQFCPIINDFPATVTALEVGMVGPWGEMHSSNIIKDPATINTLIATFLESTTEFPVLVRTPRMIRSYLALEDHSDDYRLGIFNDGYLGTETDIGTYDNREEDVAFVAERSEHLPFGGEVTVPGCSLHDIEVCLPEMYQIHLSYLNEQWNDQVVGKWKKTLVTEDCEAADPLYYGKTAYEYIQGHMGYRFVLKKATFTYTDRYDNIKIELKLENTGFGNLNKTKKAKLLFVKSGEIAYEKTVEDFTGESEINYSLPIKLNKGQYDVYLRLYGDEHNGKALYSLKFANTGVYSSLLTANRIGKLTVV